MKRSLLALPVCLALAACGSAGHHTTINSNSPQVQQGTKVVDSLANKCIKNPLALRTKAGRTAAENCAFPPKNRAAGSQCLFHVAFSGVPTKARIKAGADACILKYA